MACDTTPDGLALSALQIQLLRVIIEHLGRMVRGKVCSLPFDNTTDVSESCGTPELLEISGYWNKTKLRLFKQEVSDWA